MKTREKIFNKKIKILLFLITLVVIVLLIRFAYAKYMTQLNGDASADIARFNFSVKAGSRDELIVDLGKTRNGVQQVANVQEGYVGPGTAGKFDIIINATNSETSLEYEINMDVDYQNNNIFPKNLIFYSDAEMKNAIYHSNNNININGYIPYSESNKVQTKTIYWKWDYETGQTQDEKDVNDIADSYWMGKDITLLLNVIGKQVNTNPTINQHEITFDANGGVIEGYGNAKMMSKNIIEGSYFGELPIPKKDGYVFSGWYGKNLLDISERTIYTSSWSGADVKRTLTGNGIYIGISANNYWIYESILDYKIDDIENNISVASKTTGAGYGIGFDLKVEPNTTYSIKVISKYIINIGEYSKDGTWLGWHHGVSRTFTTTQNTEWIMIVVAGDGMENIINATNLQFEKNDNYTSFEHVNKVNENTTFNYQTNYILCARWTKNKE